MIRVYEKVEGYKKQLQHHWNQWRQNTPLFWVQLQFQWFNFKEYLKVVFLYYRNLSFLKTDLLLLLYYLFQNPYRMNKDFLKKRGEEVVDVYGETPLTTFEQIVSNSQITPNDIVYELGSGRGRTSLWLHSFIGCKVIGVEIVPEFVKIANQVKKKCNLSNIQFENQNFLEMDFKDATVIYLYGICLKEEEVFQLVDKLKNLPKGTKIITVSFPLTEYTKEPLFEVMNCFQGVFPWGITDIYLHYKK